MLPAGRAYDQVGGISGWFRQIGNRCLSKCRGSERDSAEKCDAKVHNAWLLVVINDNRLKKMEYGRRGFCANTEIADEK